MEDKSIPKKQRIMVARPGKGVEEGWMERVIDT